MTIATGRLLLAPLRADDADELVDVLDDERLHEFTGGRPATLDELRDRYRRLAAGSTTAGETWRNWIVRRRADSKAVGMVQATIRGRTAWIAWVVGVPFQRQGFASEAAIALVDGLRGEGVEEVRAHVHPDHRASAAVAARAGLEPTRDESDGEVVWRLTL